MISYQVCASKVKRALCEAGAEPESVVVSYKGGKVSYKRYLAATWKNEQIQYEGSWWEEEEGKKVRSRVEELLEAVTL